MVQTKHQFTSMCMI
ncbi:hypothetical protein LINPERHAP1_LOCUS34550 [Linum perenne]